MRSAEKIGVINQIITFFLMLSPFIISACTDDNNEQQSLDDTAPYFCCAAGADGAFLDEVAIHDIHLIVNHFPTIIYRYYPAPTSFPTNIVSFSDLNVISSCKIGAWWQILPHPPVNHSSSGHNIPGREQDERKKI